MRFTASPCSPLLRAISGATLALLLPGSALAQGATISGLVWSDENGDGRRQRDEPGLAGVTIYLDFNRSGSFDRGEIAAFTLKDNPETAIDEAGQFWFTELPPADYDVREVVPSGYLQTFPRSGYSVRVRPDEVLEGLDFGLEELLLGSVHGRVWNDSNANAQRDPSEPGLGGVQIFADLNQNCRYDREEPHATSMSDDPETAMDEEGLYWLTDLEPGWVQVRQVQSSDHVPTFPANGVHEVLVAIEGAVDGVDFGNDAAPGFAQTAPDRLDLEFAIGTTHDEVVSMSIEPLCLRPFNVEVLPSDPAALLVNLSGILENGCGGDTTSFTIRFTAAEAPQCFRLEFVDADFGAVLGSIPVTVVPEPGVRSMVIAAWVALGLLARRRGRPSDRPARTR